MSRMDDFLLFIFAHCALIGFRENMINDEKVNALSLLEQSTILYTVNIAG